MNLTDIISWPHKQSARKEKEVREKVCVCEKERERVCQREKMKQTKGAREGKKEFDLMSGR